MLAQKIRDALSSILPARQDDDTGPDPVDLAVAALFVELVRADFEVQESERRMVIAALGSIFELDEPSARELLAAAEDRANETVSLFEYTDIIHNALSPSDKIEVVEHLFRIAFADGHLGDHEDHMLRKVRGLLHIPQRDYIAAKQRARQAAEPAAKTT